MSSSEDDWRSVTFASIFSSITIVGILGNAVVIFAIAMDSKMRRSVMNILLLNLAVADMLNIFTNMWEWIPKFYGKEEGGGISWLLPEYLCPLCRYLENVFLYASISTQIVVCVERYVAIVYPMRARFFCIRRNAFIGVAASWMYAIAYAYPHFHVHSVSKRHDRSICSNLSSRERWFSIYKLSEFIIFYAFPCILIIILYTKIAVVLWWNTGVGETQKCLVEHRRKNDNLRTRRNVVKMLLACVMMYFICYSPIQIIFLSRMLFQKGFQPTKSVVLIFTALTLLCSASNPLLYTLFSTKFRRKLKAIAGCSVCSLTRKTCPRDPIHITFAQTHTSGSGATV